MKKAISVGLAILIPVAAWAISVGKEVATNTERMNSLSRDQVRQEKYLIRIEEKIDDVKDLLL